MKNKQVYFTAVNDNRTCSFQANEFQYNKSMYLQTAREWTKKHAMDDVVQVRTEMVI